MRTTLALLLLSVLAVRGDGPSPEPPAHVTTRLDYGKAEITTTAAPVGAHVNIAKAGDRGTVTCRFGDAPARVTFRFAGVNTMFTPHFSSVETFTLSDGRYVYQCPFVWRDERGAYHWDRYGRRVDAARAHVTLTFAPAKGDVVEVTLTTRDVRLRRELRVFWHQKILGW